MAYNVEWYTRDKDGITKAEKFEHIGYPDPPELEPGSDHILLWFYQLNAQRQASFSGAAAFSFSDIKAWQELSGVIVRPEEVSAILEMDVAYRNALHDFQEKGKERDKRK